jgi:hypothetical protein
MHDEAATLHAEASDRWHAFGDVAERAYALLGHGRCLVTLSRPGAEQPLREAADILTALGYRPAWAETQMLQRHTVTS